MTRPMDSRLCPPFPVTVSRVEVSKILNAHGWTFKSITAWDKSNHAIADSDFDSEMGIHETYRLRDVKTWLGY